MPAVRAANVAELVAVMTGSGKNYINKFHVAYGGVAPLSSAEANALAADFSNVYRTRFFGRFNVGIFAVQFEANDIDPSGFATGLDTTAAAGVLSGGGLPLSNSVVCHWRNEAPRYRGGKTRTYFGGMDISELSAPNLLSSAALSAWQTSCTGFISDINSLTFGTGPRSVTLIYLETVRSKVHLPTPAQWPITSAAVRQNLGSQRRRVEP